MYGFTFFSVPNGMGIYSQGVTKKSATVCFKTFLRSTARPKTPVWPSHWRSLLQSSSHSISHLAHYLV